MSAAVPEGTAVEPVNELTLQKLIIAAVRADQGVARAILLLVQKDAPAGPLHAWELSPSYCPDIVIADDHDNVLVVIEVKIGARTNVLLATTVRKHLDWTNARAAKIATTLQLNNEEATERHDWTPDCACYWHLYRGGGTEQPKLGSAGISQFDAYVTLSWLSESGIIDRNDPSSRLHSSDPDDVAFLFLNPSGRALERERDRVVFPDPWRSASFTALADDIEDLAEEPGVEALLGQLRLYGA